MNIERCRSRGHEPDLNPRGDCRVCNRQSRARWVPKPPLKCVNGHDKAREGTSSRGHCLRCHRERERVRKAEIKAFNTPDGFEAEFGPKPERVDYADWYDQVAVDREVSGVRPVGRRLTPLEGAEVERIRSEKETRTKDLTWALIPG